MFAWSIERAILIKQALESGWLTCVDNPVFSHPLSRSLGLGEQTSIEYALQTDTKTLLIMDDALARKQATSLNLMTVTLQRGNAGLNAPAS